MKHSTTLVALVTLILSIAWGCSGNSDPVTPGGNNNAANVTSTNNSTNAGTPTSTTTGTTTTGGVTCVAPQMDCGGACANITTDPANCGACGNACMAGEACNSGSCGCPGGGMACNGACVDVTTSATNCGSCGNACGTGATCMAGQCTCQAGLMDCGTGCVNLQSNFTNCGACGTACTAPQVCSQGACSDTCADGLENCDGSCVDVMSDSANCGACANACPGGLACTAGACACEGGQTSCNGTCVDTMTSATNCGACGTACPATATCVAGACACPDGQEACGTECVAAGMCQQSACANANSLMISDFEGATPLEVTGDANQFSGLWEGFGDGTGTQTFEVEPVTDAECGSQALHTTGSGFSDWGVGIGFSLAGMPEAPTVYDASAWKGIRFKAKKGSGGLTPVRFNISIPASEGIDSGGTCDPSTARDGCYNHPGRFLEGSYEVGSEWRTYHFCFDRDLYPQFLPSDLTNAQRSTISSNVLKMQFIFNKAIDPNKDVETDANGGLYDLNSAFDFWVDDVEFTNDECPDNVYKGTGSKAFPQNKATTTCPLAPNVAAFNGAISEYYAEWKKNFLKSDGSVYSPEDGRTISEGMGYGLLIAASMGDKEAFDSMWSYTNNNLKCSGLMTWKGGAGSCEGSATDADADIAYGLMLAAAQWGGDYGTRASSMVSAMSADLSGNRIKPGTNYDGSWYNPSYFTPAYYDNFGGNWASVRSEGITFMQTCDAGFGSGSDGLVADWHDSSGTAVNSGQTGAQVVSNLCPEGTASTDCKVYGFDAARVPWRMGVDACLTGDAGSKGYLQELVGHFVELYGAGNMEAIRSGYRADGGAHADSVEMQASFIGPVGVGAMSVNQEAYQRIFRVVLDIMRDMRFNRTYYPTTLGLITLLEMSGNVPHP